MWPYPHILAHRGGGTRAPENTLAAMRCGLAYGFHAVEFDVMLSRDGVPILMHDDQMGRTVAGCGHISQLTAAEVLALDAGAWFGPQFVGERVPTFADVIAFCKAHGIWMNVEIKPASGFERETGQAVAVLVQQMFAAEIAARAHGADAAALPLLSSFSYDALQAAQRTAVEIPRGLLMDRVLPDWQSALQELDAVALHTNHQHLSPELTAQVKAAGYGLLCYTVNDVQRATDILAWGVDAFCTDRIDLIAADFREKHED